MIDLQRDSPVPIHEQIASQVMAHVAAGDLLPGAILADYRAFAQELLTNPQVVARAYADLEWAGVLKKHPTGGMEVIAGAHVICKARLQDTARQRLAAAVRQGLAAGLSEADVRQAVDNILATPPVAPLSPAEISTSIKTSAHASSHRTSQGVQELPRQKGRGPA
jgi:GntR family transcriptional regulator